VINEISEKIWTMVNQDQSKLIKVPAKPNSCAKPSQKPASTPSTPTGHIHRYLTGQTESNEAL
jgi:hypothetical protein